MEIPEMHSVGMLELKVIGHASAASAFIGAPDGSMYDEPMVVLKLDWANCMGSLEEPMTSHYVLEPTHAIEVAQALAKAGFSAMVANQAQKGRPDT